MQKNIKSFIVKNSLHDHNYYKKSSSSDSTSSVYKDSFSTDTVLQDEKLHKKQSFVCQLCEKSFSYESSLWKHIMIHSGS